MCWRTLAGDLAVLFAKLGEQLGGKLIEQLGEHLRPIAAALQRGDAVSVSGVDSTRWQQLEVAMGLAAFPSLPPADVPRRRILRFEWDDRNERAQSERYIPYLKDSFTLCANRERSLTWIAGDAHKDLLSVSAPVAGLPFTLNGTCDAAVVTTEAYKNNLYSRGLVLLFELKKGNRFTSREVHQASTQLLLANILSPETKPVVVLTDLDQQWRILHFDSQRLHTVSLDDNRDAAVGLIDKILASYCASGGEAGSEPSEEVDGVGGVVDSIFKRRRLFKPSSELALAGDVGNVADLAGFLPDREYMETQAAALVALFLRTPGIAEGLRGNASGNETGIVARVGSSSPPPGMYF